MGKEFFSTVILSLHDKKAISLRLINKKTYVKLNSSKGLDSVERHFYKILKRAKELTEKEDLIDNSFDMKKSFSNISLGYFVNDEIRELSKEIKEDSKRFLDTKGINFINISSGICLFLAFITNNITISIDSFLYLIGLYLSLGIITNLTNSKTSLFSKYNEEYYGEYLHWQAYKRYMSHSFSIKEGGFRAIAIWNKILLYTTALGASKKVLKELKSKRLISENDSLIYLGVFNASTSIYRSNVAATTGGSTGGFSGAGMGGIGGGGGGGR